MVNAIAAHIRQSWLGYLLLVIIESTWLTALLVASTALQDATAPAPNWLVVAGSVLLNLSVNELPDRSARDYAAIALRVCAALLTIAVFNLQGISAVLVIFALYVTWHQRSLADLDTWDDRLRSSVFAGIGGVLVSIVIRAIAPAFSPVAAGEHLLFTLCFLVAALAGLSLAQRVEVLGTAALSSKGTKSWLISLTAGVAAAAMAVALAVSLPTVAGLVGVVLHLLGTIIGTILFYLLVPIAYVLFTFLFGPLADWLHGLQRNPVQQPAVSGAVGKPPIPQDTTTAMSFNPGPLLLWAVVMILAIVVIVVISRNVRARRSKTSRRSDERESVFAWSLLGAWLSGALGGVGSRLAATRLPSLSRRWREREPASARELYVLVQRYAAEVGEARESPQTAQEHCQQLCARFDALAPELQEVANAYAAEHYGGQAPPGGVASLLPAWHHIRTTLQEATPHGS